MNKILIIISFCIISLPASAVNWGGIGHHYLSKYVFPRCAELLNLCLFSSPAAGPIQSECEIIDESGYDADDDESDKILPILQQGPFVRNASSKNVEFIEPKKIHPIVKPNLEDKFSKKIQQQQFAMIDELASTLVPTDFMLFLELSEEQAANIGTAMENFVHNVFNLKLTVHEALNAYATELGLSEISAAHRYYLITNLYLRLDIPAGVKQIPFAVIRLYDREYNLENIWNIISTRDERLYRLMEFTRKIKHHNESNGLTDQYLAVNILNILLLGQRVCPQTEQFLTYFIIHALTRG